MTKITAIVSLLAALLTASVADAAEPATQVDRSEARLSPVAKVIYFEYESTQLPPESTRELRSFVTQLQHRPGLRLGVRGYADTLGSELPAIELAAKRAAAIKQTLVLLGIPADDVTLMESLAENAENEAGRARNQRVEIYVIRN